MSQAKRQPNAGVSMDSMKERPDRVPLKKGEYSVASRALALSTYFLSGALAINLSQFLGSPLYLVNQDWYNAWIAFTKQSFGLLTMTLTQAFAPTKVVVSGDASVRGQLHVSRDGNLVLNFPHRIVLMANHQIYTDWLYLWWVAYCNGMHGRLYIILKESLKKIPILGWGMQMSQFIFLKRNWEKDKPHMADALEKLNKAAEPMWLMLFPEGTNLAPDTREKSAKWAAKNSMKDMMHTLLPRSTGLQFCLQQLAGTVDYLYDCTIAYEGVPRGQFAQDIFTLKAGYLEGRPPKSVHMYWRRFAVKDIPLHNDKAFELWLVARWREKDLLIEQYLQNGRFPADRGATKYPSGKVMRGTGHSEVQIRSSHWYEFLQIFAPMGVLAMILAVFYGALPKSFWSNFNKQAIQSSTQDIKKASQQAGSQVKAAGAAAGGLTLDDIFDADKQEDSFKKGALAVQQWLGTPQAQTAMNRVDFATQFFQNPEKAVVSTIKGQRKDFMHAIQEEEERRRKQNLPHSSQNAGVQKGRFWDDLERLDNSRHGSVISESSTSSRKPTGTFYADLQAAERRKKGQGLQLGAAGTFWDKVKTEENSRYGTVRTISSNASSFSTNRPPSLAPSNRPSLSTQRRASAAPSIITTASGPPRLSPAEPRPSLSRASSSTSTRTTVSAPQTKSVALSKPAPLSKSGTSPKPTPPAKASAKTGITQKLKPVAASKPQTKASDKPAPSKPAAPKVNSKTPVPVKKNSISPKLNTSGAASKVTPGKANGATTNKLKPLVSKPTTTSNTVKTPPAANAKGKPAPKKLPPKPVAAKK
jgi:1-acyl-sn-glycerol-3-phosphate acyltransferase